MDIKGFRFSAVEAAIKKPGRKDLALIFSEVPANACAVFTVNAVKAAPVLLSMEHIKGGSAQAVVVNSGNANACTGDAGMIVARETANLVAQGLGISDQAVQVSSTGVIGVPMPMKRIRDAIPPLIEGLSSGTLDDVAQAIMTTDTFPKMEAREAQVRGTNYTVAGIAKGSGMIMPNMATMLSYIISDAAVEPVFLERAFREAVAQSFNSITVDGDMSTNDTCLIMANGMAGNDPIRQGTAEGNAFEALLNDVLLSLAKQIARDGEGATKFVEVRVSGARGDDDARLAARAIANSCLVKPPSTARMPTGDVSLPLSATPAPRWTSRCSRSASMTSSWHATASSPAGMPSSAAPRCSGSGSSPSALTWAWAMAAPRSTRLISPTAMSASTRTIAPDPAVENHISFRSSLSRGLF
jgi:glutamate N-acetyltransferase / amino-acid N-acetyltransferase